MLSSPLVASGLAVKDGFEHSSSSSTSVWAVAQGLGLEQIKPEVFFAALCSFLQCAAADVCMEAGGTT